MKLQKPFLLFDGDCGICQRSASFIKKIDAAERINIIPYQSLSESELATLNLDIQRCNQAIQWVHQSSDNKIKNYSGANAVNRFFWEFWPWKILVILIYAIPIIYLFELLIYPIIAHNRMHISKALGLDTCKIPERKI